MNTISRWKFIASIMFFGFIHTSWSIKMSGLRYDCARSVLSNSTFSNEKLWWLLFAHPKRPRTRHSHGRFFVPSFMRWPTDYSNHLCRPIVIIVLKANPVQTGQKSDSTRFPRFCRFQHFSPVSFFSSKTSSLTNVQSNRCRNPSNLAWNGSRCDWYRVHSTHFHAYKEKNTA